MASEMKNNELKENKNKTIDYKRVHINNKDEAQKTQKTQKTQKAQKTQKTQKTKTTPEPAPETAPDPAPEPAPETAPEPATETAPEPAPKTTPKKKARPKKPRTLCRCGGYFTGAKKRHEETRLHRDFMEGED